MSNKFLSGHYNIDMHFLNKYKRKNGRNFDLLLHAFCCIYGKYVDDNNAISFYDEEGELHNDNGPALIKESGEHEYYFHGMRHREGAPAVIKEGETEYWEYDVRIK